MPFFTEGSSSFPLPFLFEFCKCHHWMDSLTPVFIVLGSSFWFLQELPSAGPRLRKLENTDRSAFQVFCCLHHLSALSTQAKPWTTLALPRCPCPQHQWLPCFPGLATTTFLMFPTTTRPLVLSSVHSTSLTTRNPSWVIFQPGRLVELLKRQR